LGLRMNASGLLVQKVKDYYASVVDADDVVAVAFVDLALKNAFDVGAAQVLLVVRDFKARMMSAVKVFDRYSVFFLFVDQWVFERDVDRGFLGEGLAGVLILPYVPFEGAAYLHHHEVLLKKRLILELLEDLVLSFPNLSFVMRIKPEYFMYETLLNRIRVFPPLVYTLSDFLSGVVPINMVKRVLDGYLEALEGLACEGKVCFSEGYVIIPQSFVFKCKSPQVRLTSLLRNAPRAFFTPVFNVFPQFLSFMLQQAEGFTKVQRGDGRVQSVQPARFVDSRSFVYVPTAHGLVSLADRVDVKALARQLFGDSDVEVNVEPFGGILNDVYLLHMRLNGVEKQVLAKRFRDWSNLKWLPLTMWSTGARTFAVGSRERLEREFLINSLLRQEGFSVPKILHVSHVERVIFMEYIDGKNFTAVIEELTRSASGESQGCLALVAKAGETVAKVHKLNICLGDTKPENFIVDREGRVWLVDFEQGELEGDRAWDVAEFLYYSGHYFGMGFEDTARVFAEAFIHGYLCAGGSAATVQDAGKTKYVRVFSIFTLPSIMRVMSEACRKTGRNWVSAK